MGESSSCNICTYRQIAQKQDNLLSIFCLFEQIAAYELTEGNSPLIHPTHTCIYLTFNLKNARKLSLNPSYTYLYLPHI